MSGIVAKQLVFAVLDTDGDGVISRDDYFTRIDRLTAATKRTEDDPMVVLARAAGERAWAEMDADGDGRMTRDQYLAWVGVDAFDNICSPALGALFDLADSDGDGAVDREEFILLRTALGNPSSNAVAAFAALDVDGDGLVGRGEYLTSIRTHISGEHSPMGAVLYAARV
ncbi:EF-hand domain-containing protein [Streptomyces albireticuli]|uniref:Calcium-binding protein n=1 Tax=Streptomyces albireticuli TaxID=1940 RepID=A0A2A2DDI3_9ACTN|nr:EF-hand domain-containing protein [Streptomyces albireticuli]MCD9143921.1 EF-hand domain-containing protein [Streptomyces albireticuli]MCD9161648.1 EF-hand domain-containing protein [Streptomyces albireticuli]MCD9192038.1 EF-hand domain-containing protein [Streptomyces albireticuli]PAU50523.1 calcium-binding protein [Streptomyces albireticuli]